MIITSKEIIRLRKDRGLTQEVLAELTEVSRQAVAKWEKGESLPDLEKLIRISDIFKVTIDSLVRASESCSHSKDNLVSHDSLIREFLCRAKKKTYAGKGHETESSRPASHDLSYREGNLLYLDTYLGGSQFAGEEALWLDNEPFWSMNYSGRVTGESFSGDFLKESLKEVSPEFPYRGPEIYCKGDYTYHCRVQGEFSWFRGSEEIYCRGKLVYECLFHGGDIYN